MSYDAYTAGHDLAPASARRGDEMASVVQELATARAQPNFLTVSAIGMQEGQLDVRSV